MDSRLLAPELVAGVQRVKSAKSISARKTYRQFGSYALQREVAYGETGLKQRSGRSLPIAIRRAATSLKYRCHQGLCLVRCCSQA